MPKVTVYYDPISPWSMFNHTLLTRYEKVWKLDIELRPTLLGGIMVGSKNSPPLTVPNKFAHMGADMEMASKYWGIPYKFPTAFPVNTINCVRLLRVIQEHDKASKLREASEAFYQAIWGPGAGDAKEAVSIPGCTRLLTPLFDAKTLAKYLEESGSAANKDRVKQEALDLVASGAFGAPWMVAVNDAGESANFFGSDRYELMAFFLGKPYLGPHPEKAKL